MAKKYKCLITGEALPQEKLYRFVLSEDNRLVFDPDFELEGKDFIISNDHNIVSQCFLGDLFSTIFEFRIDSEAIKQQVLRHFYNKLLTFIALAKKSGKLLQGRMQVEQYIKEKPIKNFVLIQAKDASEGEKFKLRDFDIIEIFTTEELSKVLGAEMVKYAIVTENFANHVAELNNKYIFFKSLNDR
jgi:predicted RNA-binding protein YlxR (DUF448 family)